ncbi:MAG TPA: riboflavin synthase [Candidatus Acidoferrales bacterium]|nr:riboflavin synthase [Candidatus Acidoferrales bacterium]
MFTGIIEHLGKVEGLKRNKKGGRLKVGFGRSIKSADAKAFAPELQSELQSKLKIGASIAVNGCCLTVVETGKGFFVADLSTETLHRTSFDKLAAGRVVNLELPVRAGAPFGGHFVQGHVDGVGRVEHLKAEGENWWLAIGVPEDLRRYVAEKGSLAVDGISLTVARWNHPIADFAIIPHTYANTNLREVAAGDSVNLECDILAKYVENLMKGRAEIATSRWTIEKLTEEGF